MYIWSASWANPKSEKQFELWTKNMQITLVRCAMINVHVKHTGRRRQPEAVYYEEESGDLVEGWTPSSNQAWVRQGLHLQSSPDTYRPPSVRRNASSMAHTPLLYFSTHQDYPLPLTFLPHKTHQQKWKNPKAKESIRFLGCDN